MLKLGIESEGACNPIARAVGTEVLKTFPEELVKHYKTTSSMQGLCGFFSFLYKYLAKIT